MITVLVGPSAPAVDARLIVVGLVFPIVVGVVVWAVTARRKDQAAVAQILASLPKAEAESEVAEQTVTAAIELADVNTLQAHVTAMGHAFREERESLTRRLDECEETLRETLDEVDELREAQRQSHREILDMYRRDQYHDRALRLVGDWLAENLPKLRGLLPDLREPPRIAPLPSLYIGERDGDLVARHYWDRSN